MFRHDRVRVCEQPVVELGVALGCDPAGGTLLVIHGGPDWDHSYLLDPLADLARSRQVVFADLRGCGRSTSGLADKEYHPDAVVADLVALLDALGVARADVLGFSYGGLLAQRLTLAAPQRVHRLVVASSSVSPVPPDAFDGWQERARRRAAEAEVWSDPSLSGPALTRAAAVAGAAANVWRAESLEGYLDRLDRVRFSAEWLRPWQAGTLPSALPENSARRLAALGVPLLLLHGRQDMTFPAALAEEVAELIPLAGAVVIEEAGHMTHVDAPGEWLAAVSGFLS